MSNETTPPPVPVGEGFLRKFLNKFSASRDKGLREDLESVIDTHQAQNPQDGPGQETRSMMRNLIKFLEEGDKTKITLRFRGREMTHQELGYNLLKRVEAELMPHGTVEQFPKMEGRQMVMVLSPKKKV